MFTDHFNWPTPNRGDTMYLGTIRPEETGLTKKAFFTQKSPNLDISDIDKARPAYQGYQYLNKETFGNRNDDIAGSQPKKLHQPLEKVYYGMRTDDLKGAKPQCQKFVTTRNPTDPLNPEYKLPKVEVRMPTPPKFIRDSIAIDDIEGAKPNPYTRYNIQRNTNNVSDIDGARPKKEWLPQGKASTLDVKDINAFYEFHTKRQTDPLSPRYKVIDQTNELVDYGKLDNKPMVRHPKEVNKPTSFDLKTSDIDGAQANATMKHYNNIATRQSNLKTQDIPGAQIGSLRKGMTTIRQSDPLWPIYQVPGHSEPAPIYTRNLKPNGPPQKATVRSASQLSMKSNLISPGDELTKFQDNYKSQLIQSQNVEGMVRKPSGEKTPPPQSDKKVLNSFVRTGEELLGGDKSKGVEERSEYAASRLTNKNNSEPLENNKQKAGNTGTNLEAKKALNPAESHQKNVANFFGMSSADEMKSSKPLSVAEKFDRFISK